MVTGWFSPPKLGLEKTYIYNFLTQNSILKEPLR